MPRPANHRRWSSRAATHADSSATAACDESARAMRGTPPASHRRDDRHGAAIAAVDGAAPQRVSPHPSRCAALRSTTRASIEGQKRSCGARSGAARSRRPTDERPRRDRERATGTSRCQRLPVNGAPRVIDRGHRVAVQRPCHAAIAWKCAASCALRDRGVISEGRASGTLSPCAGRAPDSRCRRCESIGRGACRRQLASAWTRVGAALIAPRTWGAQAVAYRARRGGAACADTRASGAPHAIARSHARADSVVVRSRDQ